MRTKQKEESTWRDLRSCSPVRIARELEMDVVLNQSVATERILDLMEDCRRTGADILVARGRQASIL